MLLLVVDRSVRRQYEIGFLGIAFMADRAANLYGRMGGIDVYEEIQIGVC